MEMRYENKCSESGWLVSGFRASNFSVFSGWYLVVYRF